MSLKGRINHYAKQNGIAAQVVLQNYMFERFLERLSRSEYQQKFVIKGGMLVTAIVGIDTRATMDLDTTLRNLPLTEPQIREAITAICSVPVDDEVSFQIISIEPIRKDDVYGGYRVRLDATYDTVLTPLSIDISTGDVITPNPKSYELHGLFNPDLKISLWGYNVETILAEKVETILRRGVFSTRPRDFYDVYILKKTQDYQPDLFRKALKATVEHRGSTGILQNTEAIIARLESSEDLKRQWARYQRQFPYAVDIPYALLMESLRRILNSERLS
jgi:predicted nucleotidyltransferase component of viral defense system